MIEERVIEERVIEERVIVEGVIAKKVTAMRMIAENGRKGRSQSVRAADSMTHLASWTPAGGIR